MKPHTLSVSEKVKYIERLAAEVQKPIKTKSEDNKEADPNSKVVESTVESVHILPVDTDDIGVNNEEYKRYNIDYSM